MKYDFLKSDPVLLKVKPYNFRASHILMLTMLCLGVWNIIYFQKYFYSGLNLRMDIFDRAQRHEELIIRKTKKILNNKIQWERYTLINNIIYGILLLLTVYFNKSAMVGNLINYLFIVLLIQQY